MHFFSRQLCPAGPLAEVYLVSMPRRLLKRSWASLGPIMTLFQKKRPKYVV